MPKPSTESNKPVPASERTLIEQLKAELSSLKKEVQRLRQLSKETQDPVVRSKLLKEERTLEKTVGKLALDLAEEIPFLGRWVKHFREQP